MMTIDYYANELILVSRLGLTYTSSGQTFIKHAHILV